jgi:hypothetical protein
MASMIRPSLILKMDLDEHVYSDETAADIKRSYSYVAPSVITSHETGDARPENTMRFKIKLHRPYWDATNDAANELWSSVMPKWMHNMLYKVSSTITACNKVHTERGEQDLPYMWLEMEFGSNVTIALKTASDSSLSYDYIEFIEQARKLMAQGVFGEESVARICIPSKESYEAQLKEAEEAEEAAKAAKAEEVEDTADVTDAAEGIEEEATETEAESLSEDALDAQDAEDAEDSEDVPVFEWPKLPEFDVDYSIWGIEYANGTVRSFNSVEGSFEE